MPKNGNGRKSAGPRWELSRNVALSVVNIIREGLVEDGLGWSRPRPGGLPRSLVRGTY